EFAVTKCSQLRQRRLWYSDKHKMLRLRGCQCTEQRLGSGYPAENSALGLDHGQSHVVKLGEIGGAAISENNAAESAVVRLADRRVDADFGCDTADEQRVDGAIMQHQFEI